MLQLFYNLREFVIYNQVHNPDALFKILLITFIAAFTVTSCFFGSSRKLDDALVLEAIKPISGRKRARINACLALEKWCK